MHMKKVVLFLVSLLMLTMVFACDKGDIPYDNWKRIEINDCGSIEIPSEWSYFYEDGKLYIVDENAEPVMIQSDNRKVYEGDSNKFYGNYKKIELIDGENYSNSSTYEVFKFLLDDKEVELQNIKLFVDPDEETLLDKDVNLIVWKTDIGEKVVKKIAKSFDGSGR